MNGSERILVTGAGGFTGGAVARLLLEEGRTVRAMVRNKADAAKLRQMGAEVVFADLTERESLTAAVDGCSAVLHIAALFRQAGLPEEDFIRVNVEGTRMLLEAAERFGVKRFIHCSTIGVHGDIEEPPASEDYRYAPGDMYQRSKVAAEEVAFSFFRENRVRGVVIRPAMIYGPDDKRTLKLFQMISRGKFFYVGKGEAFVHFIDVRDLARAFVLAVDKDELHNRAYIIGGREAMPLNQLVDRISTVLEVNAPKLHLPVRPVQLLGTICEAVCTPFRINPPLYRRRVDFFTKSRHFNCDRATAELGFSPAQDSYGELVDIINSYVASGEIEGKILSDPCHILRTREGEILNWDERAENYYGLHPQHAVGQISHSLFETTFPTPIHDINKRLFECGRWVGNLRHASRSHGHLSVLSHWRLSDDSRPGEHVIEENRMRFSVTKDAGRRTGNPKVFVSSLAAHYPALVPLLE